MAETFPFYLPPEAKRLYTSDGVVRRVALTAHWSNQVKVVELAATQGGISLAKEIDCEVTLADTDDAVLRTLDERVKAGGLTKQVHTQKVPGYASLPFEEGSLDGILVLGRLLMGLNDAAAKLRPYLALRGRLVLTWPVKVGLRPAKASLDFWEKRLGTALMTPRETLMAVEKHGYEPETIETPAELEMDEFYRSVEAGLGKAPPEAAAALKQEIDVHRDAGGRSGVAIALLVARRKEPGERPPAARDGG
jgi:hypothetical protein